MVTWVFAIVMAIGVFYLFVTLVLGELFDIADDALDGLDDLLEGVGIDLLPDAFESVEGDSNNRIGCSTIAAFFAGFGAAGLFASLMEAGLLLSLFVAILFGLLTGAMYFGLMGLLYKQEASTTIRTSDFIGLHGRVSINSDAGSVGQVTIEVGGTRKAYPALEVSGKGLVRDETVEVIQIEAGRLLVRRISVQEMDKGKTRDVN